jgi:hypothetical protein
MTVLALLIAMALDLSRVNSLTPVAAARALDQVRAERAKREPVWRPQHRKLCVLYKRNHTEAEWRRENDAGNCTCPQPLAYWSKADITGYGGAAGGGKSDLIIGTAETQHRRGIIFRREHTQVRSLLQRAGEMAFSRADLKAKVNHGTSVVYIQNGDRQLEFGGIKHPDDWQKHKGNAKDFFGFDETDQFEELMVRQIIGWNRSTIPGQRCRVIFTFNPPGKRGQWLITFFAPWLDPKHPNPAKDGELRWFTTINAQDIEVDGSDPIELHDDEPAPICVPVERDAERCPACGSEIVFPLSRTFIKALLSDNQHLAETNYRATLMALPEPLRSQLLHGDFQAEEVDDPNQVIPMKWVQLAQQRWLDMEPPAAPLSAIGADPARGGKDRTAFCARIGTWFDEPVCYPGIETPKGGDVLMKLAEVARGYKIERKVPVGMDVIGVGASPADLAEELGIQLIAMNASETEGLVSETDSSGMLPFANKRAFWYWRLREALDPDKGENLALPPDRELLADLCAPQYRVGLGGIIIESKDDIKKRIGRSPDKGDALVYAFNTRPVVIGYQTVQARPSTAHIASPLRSNWKRQRGM